MSDQYRSVNKTPFKWYFAGGPTLARFLLYFQMHIFGAQKSLYDETVLLSTKNLR